MDSFLGTALQKRRIFSRFKFDYSKCSGTYTLLTSHSAFGDSEWAKRAEYRPNLPLADLWHAEMSCCVFVKMDFNKSGTLDKEEFRQVMMVVFGNVILQVIVQWAMTIMIVPASKRVFNFIANLDEHGTIRQTRLKYHLSPFGKLDLLGILYQRKCMYTPEKCAIYYYE